MLLLGSIFVLLAGAFMLFAPDAFYELTESWKNGSASGPATVCTRASAGAFSRWAA